MCGFSPAAAEVYMDASVQAPMVGRWSDAYGRKPFLLLSFLCGGAQVFALLTYLTLGTSLFWMFPAQASSGSNLPPCALGDSPASILWCPVGLAAVHSSKGP